MVTRKPVPQTGGVGAGLAPSPSSSPPLYPVPPSSTNEPQTLRAAPRPSADSEPEIETLWEREGGQDGKQSSGPYAYQPPPNEFPRSLQGGLPELPNSISQEMPRPSPTSTNPFLQRQVEKHGTQESSTAPAWGGFSQWPTQPDGAPPCPPVSQKQEEPPSELFAGLSTIEPSTNPWQPALDEKPRVQHPPIPTIQREDSGSEAWFSTALDRQTPINSTSEPHQQPVLVDIDEPESPAWDEDTHKPSPPVQPPGASTQEEAQQLDKDRNVWGDNQGHILEHDTIAAGHFVTLDDQPQPSEGWSLVDYETVRSDTQQTGVVLAEDATQPQKGRESDSSSLPLQSQELPSQPRGPVIPSGSRSTSSAARLEVAASVIQAQKKETYEIKKISWHDVTAARNPRVSPILVQNANGPCPLLALVNALTMSTPANVETALVETLRSRERVSLGLLLDAVFDELVSGRRGDAAQELPDVGDLYSFLITLHTGMNVNPLFCPPLLTRSETDPREREEAASGTFEDTREMKLYSTFSVPLIHGWLPEPGSTEYTGLARSAQSYEDAQNLMFHEEGLEDKLAHEGLSFEEQATLEDIATIKAFFSSNATQLTPFGLQMVTTSLVPGATAILFRNDHFSTLYRHPDTLQLLQLVTDMGYAGHEEVVWESLIDVSGERAEFFSGDFRLVGGASTTPHPNIDESVASWTTTSSHRKQSQNPNIPSASLIHTVNQSIPPRSPNIEQEDHDLALALQLQEEEEERHRNEQTRQRRERETELSQQYIGQRGPRNGNVPVHIRGGRGGRGSHNRGRGARTTGTAVARPEIQPRQNNLPSTATVPAVDPEAGIDAPPPSYEQAANQEAYIPPTDHPSHPTASPDGTTTTRRRTSAYSSTSSGTHLQATPSLGRSRRQTSSSPSIIDHISPRRSIVPGAVQQQGVAQHQGKERDCIIM